MTKQLADVMDRFAQAVTGFANELRGNADNGDRDDDFYDWGNEVDDGDDALRLNKAAANGPAEDALLQVPAGDLWRLVNRTRKMIRLARQGKVPNMEDRAPLCRSIKALKAKGLVQKPYNLRDRD